MHRMFKYRLYPRKQQENQLQRHLEALSGMGLLREKRYGKIRIYEALFRSITVRFERSRGVRVETDVDQPRSG